MNMQLKTTSPSDGNSSISAHQKQLRPLTLARFKPVSLLLLLFLTLGFANIAKAQSGDAGEVTRALAEPMKLKFTTTAANQTIQLPLNGVFSVTVDWGVVGVEPQPFYTDQVVSYQFADAGNHTVSITGTLTQFGKGFYGWVGAEYLTSVRSFGELGLTSLEGAFYGASNLSEVPATLPPTVTDLSNAFANSSIASVTNLNSWDVSQVTLMNHMFHNCPNFNQDISSWDVSQVTLMKHMFATCSSFNGDISSWDVSQVTSMYCMFGLCYEFNQDISLWDVSQVTTMDGMFQEAKAFNQPIGNWNVNKVTNMQNMFDHATAFNQAIGNWNVSNVTYMTNMFNGVTLSTANYNALLSGWAAQTVKPNVGFSGGNSKYSAWVVTARAMLTNPDGNNWTIIDGGAADPDPMLLHFTTTAAGQKIYLPLKGTVDCTVDWGDGATPGTFTTPGDYLHTYAEAGTYTVSINGTLTQFGKGSSAWAGAEYLTEASSFGELGLTSLFGAFFGASNLTEVPAILPENFNVTDMSFMFAMCSEFNQDIGNWNVGNVTDMSGMFAGCTKFDQDIGGWVVSKVKNMSSMFAAVGIAKNDNMLMNFNQHIGGWEADLVENMSGMFTKVGRAKNDIVPMIFNQDISGWDVSKVTDMSFMFAFCSEFNQPLGSWTVSSVTDMSYMFGGCSNFNQNIGGWDVSGVKGFIEGESNSMDGMFVEATLSTANYDALLIGWAARENLQSGVVFHGGNSKYSSAAKEAHLKLMPEDKNHNNWTITDGGQANIFTWNGSVSNDWLTPGNWDKNTVPGATDDAVITNAGSHAVIGYGTDVNCYNLTIEEDATLTLKTSKENTGSLITKAPITGIVIVEKTIPQNGQWHLIAMPNSNTSAGQQFTGMYLQEWSEVTGLWSDIVSLGTPLNVMQGYSLWSPEVAGSSSIFTFNGTPNTGNQSIPITYTSTSLEANKGANLLGNPYPSYVDWDKVTGYGAKYTWNGMSYDAYTSTSGYGPGLKHLWPMEGFFIIVLQDGKKTFTLNNSQPSDKPQTKSTKGLEKGLVLSTSSGEKENHLYLVFDEASSEKFELSEDAWKLLSGTPGLSEVYSINADGKLSVDVRPTFETVQLGYVNDKTGIYSIGIHQIANIAELHLEDTKTNIWHNLQKGAYEFVWEEGDSETRFKLHFNSLGISEPQISESNILVFAADQQIFIKGAEAGNVQVTDLMGRLVMEQNINGGGLTVLPTNEVTGVYIVSVKTAHEIKSVKVFLK